MSSYPPQTCWNWKFVVSISNLSVATSMKEHKITTKPTSCVNAHCLTLNRIIHPVALTLSLYSVIFQMLSLLTAQFFSALGCGQHSSPSAFDPGFLTYPAVSFPERVPEHLVWSLHASPGLSRGSRGCRKPADVQTRLADWFEPVPQEAVQVASGWAFIIINYSGRQEKKEKFLHSMIPPVGCLFRWDSSSGFLCRTGSFLISFKPALQRGRADRSKRSSGSLLFNPDTDSD